MWSVKQHKHHLFLRPNCSEKITRIIVASESICQCNTRLKLNLKWGWELLKPKFVIVFAAFKVSPGFWCDQGIFLPHSEGNWRAVYEASLLLEVSDPQTVKYYSRAYGHNHASISRQAAQIWGETSSSEWINKSTPLNKTMLSTFGVTLINNRVFTGVFWRDAYISALSVIIICQHQTCNIR